jgi:hypothetical protein
MKTSVGVANALRNEMEVTFASKSHHMIRIYVTDNSQRPILTKSRAVTLSEVENSGLAIVQLVNDIKEERTKCLK